MDSLLSCVQGKKTLLSMRMLSFSKHLLKNNLLLMMIPCQHSCIHFEQICLNVGEVAISNHDFKVLCQNKIKFY